MQRPRGIWTSWLTKETVLLFGAAVGIRAVVSLVQMLQGVNGVPGLALSNWGDFYGPYIQWLGFVQKGLLPYRDFYAYKYTPLFLYTLYPFFASGGPQAASIPIVASDAATAVVVYLITKTVASSRIALAAGLLYAFCPFVLYYEDYLWLSSQPMTFFLVLGLYLLRQNRLTLSFASLATAVMFKQEALFILPAFLVVRAKDYRGSLPKDIAAFVAILVVVSLPFLMAAPRDYFSSLSYVSLPIGTAEPSLPIASAILNAVPPGQNPLGTCGISTLPGLYTGTVCGSVVDRAAFASSLLMGKLNQIAFLLEPLLLTLLAPALYVRRRSQDFLQILCIYSFLVSLVLFEEFVEASFGYYFVPVYALIFASILNKRTLLLGTGASILSVVMPEGPFQIALPLGCLFLLVALQ